MDEIKKDVTTTTATPSANTLPSNEQRIEQINNMYNSQLASQKANLESAYQQNLSNAQASKQNIDTQFNEQKNQLAAQYERQRRNNNIQAMNNGLNTGAGSQMALSQMANYQSNAAKLSKAQAQAQGEADRNLNDIQTQYQLQVNDAVAKNDYQRAAALLDEFNNQKSDMNNNAKILASYGNFSGYAQMFGQETANQMQKMWAIQNPDLAYQSGSMSAEEYKNITGRYPSNYSSGGGGGGWYPSPTGSTTSNSTSTTYITDPKTRVVYSASVDKNGAFVPGSAQALNPMEDRGNVYRLD